MHYSKSPQGCQKSKEGGVTLAVFVTGALCTGLSPHLGQRAVLLFLCSVILRRAQAINVGTFCVHRTYIITRTNHEGNGEK